MPLKVSHLTGFNAKSAAGGTGTGTVTLSKVASIVDSATASENSGFTAAFPTAVQTNDILVLGVGRRGASQTTAPPSCNSACTIVKSGTITMTATVSGIFYYGMFYKQLTAADITAGIKCNGRTDNNGYIYAAVYRPSVSGITITVKDAADSGYVANPASQTINASSSSETVIVGAGHFLDANTWDTITPAFDYDMSAGANGAAFKFYNSSPANHTVDIGSAGGSDHLYSFYLEITTP